MKCLLMNNTTKAKMIVFVARDEYEAIKARYAAYGMTLVAIKPVR